MPPASLLAYDGVVGMGGDGILSEVLHGLMDRGDWRAVAQRITVGVLPGGEGAG
jgi:diacylglycerol kinase family enzyme